MGGGGGGGGGGLIYGGSKTGVLVSSGSGNWVCRARGC